jgi:hypothetical protein
MKPEVWAVLGVVLGAVIGGGAQILNERIRYQHGRRERLSEKREAAYVELLAVCDGFRVSLMDLAEMRSTTQDLNVFERVELAEEIGGSLARQLGELQRCLQRVRLYGTDEAARSVRGMLVAIRSTVMRMQEGEPLSDDQLVQTARRIGDQQAELMRHARLEVGAEA